MKNLKAGNQLKELPDTIVHFLERQGFVIVSTLDAKGSIHCSAKGIVGIDKEGRIYIMDLYRARTLKNLRKNPVITVTSVDEHQFEGYTLKGKARIIERERIEDHLFKGWETRLRRRIANRMIKNIREEKQKSRHPEAHLPKPKHLIVMDVEEIVDLVPGHILKSPVG